MPVRQALNTVYARIVKDMDSGDRKKFIDDLYGFNDLNRAGNDALRDFREADEAMIGEGGDT